MNKLEPVSSSDLLIVGKVIRPHGLNGLLHIKSYAESEKSFLDAENVFLKTGSGEIYKFSVSSVKAHKSIFLMALEGLNSVDEAEAYRGGEILIKKGTLMRKDDTYFWHELLGLKVYLDSGEYLGTISQILSTGGNDIYVVKKGKEEIYIPAVHEVVKKIDLKN